MAIRTRPGVYISVTPEGLLTANAAARGIIAILGTSSRGGDEPELISSYSEARELFGEQEEDLTLMKAVELAFLGGAGNLLLLRVGQDYATLTLDDGLSTDLVKLTAKEGGTWAQTYLKASYASGTKTLTITEYESDGTTPKVVETFTHTDVDDLVAKINNGSSPSSLVSASKLADGTIADMSETAFSGGDNGESATPTDYSNKLDDLETYVFNYLLVAGQTDSTLHASIKSKLADWENENPVIAFVGHALGESVTEVKNRASSLNDKRMVLCSPGIKVIDRLTGNVVLRDASYTAALLCGRAAANAIHDSITNEIFPDIIDVETRYKSTELKELIEGYVTALKVRNGVRVEKYITTAADVGGSHSPYHEGSVMQIIDQVRREIWAAGEPYIGEPNNAQVRSRLKSDLDARLGELLELGAIDAYLTEVSATREQEKAGQVVVKATVRPIFSINFIEVEIILQ